MLKPTEFHHVVSVQFFGGGPQGDQDLAVYSQLLKVKSINVIMNITYFSELNGMYSMFSTFNNFHLPEVI